ERPAESGGKDMYHYALRLENGSILRISEYKDTMPSVFYTMLISVLFIMALMYIVTAVASTVLTENIVKPIRKINLSNDLGLDNIYEEIRPFLKRIARQNEEIDRQTGKVTEQKARLRAIMDNINEGLIILDRHSVILSINKPALGIFGTDEDTVKHKSSKILTDREQIHSVIRKALSGEKSNVMFESKSRTYQIFYSPIYDEEDINGAVMLLFDVTERTESEKIRREFTANVSHELKTPLTTIHGYAQIITGGIAKSEDIDGFIKKIEKESSRLMVLVDDIIELSHLDEATTDAPKQPIALKALASEVTDSLQSKAQEKDVTMEIDGTECEIYANLSQISEMVYNLVDNAIKYNKDGGRVTVTVKDKTIIV
ncbi:MAG: PAS domain S-box protein, partial [Clostridia bacterium]|nr:PAS domain S-box protein [Clostridia bacterium]